MSFIGTYILKGRQPVRCEDPLEWAMWFEENLDKRRVARTHIGECYVSTVFLGLDHGFFHTTPLLFETMAFGPEARGVFNGKPYTYNPEICSMDRYATWEEAEVGHQRIAAEVARYVLDTAVQAEEAIRAIALKKAVNGDAA